MSPEDCTDQTCNCCDEAGEVYLDAEPDSEEYSLWLELYGEKYINQ